MKIFKKTKKLKTVVTTLKNCKNCRNSVFIQSSFSDLVLCRSCGLSYYIGPEIIEPVAKLEYIEVEE